MATPTALKDWATLYQVLKPAYCQFIFLQHLLRGLLGGYIQSVAGHGRQHIMVPTGAHTRPGTSVESAICAPTNRTKRTSAMYGKESVVQERRGALPALGRYC
jgi:hypothetical protein